MARKKIYHRAKLEAAHRKLTSSKHQVSAIGRDKSTGNKDSIFGMDINSPKLVKQLMPTNLPPSDFEEATSCAPDVLSGKKGNDVSSESHAAAALGGAIMDVVNRVSDNQRKDHQRTVPRDLNFNTKARHGQSQLVKSEEDFHKELLEFQEDGAYMLERAQDNLKTFLRYRHWSKGMIKDYLANGGLMIITQLILQYFTHFLQHVTRLIARFGWENGPAQPTLAFYCEKLLKIRENSTDKLLMFLRFYAWLRDGMAKKFNDSHLQKYI